MGRPFTTIRTASSPRPTKNRTEEPGAVRRPARPSTTHAAFPSLELPSAGSRGPRPGRVLSGPPPAASQVLYGASRRASTGAIHVAAGVPRTRVPEGRASSAERARLVRPQPRIQGVAEAVPEEVEAQDGEH